MLILFLIKFSLLFMFVKSSVDDLKPIPQLKKIEIIEGDEYNFGFEHKNDDMNITKCAYTSDTGIEGEFSQVNGKLLVRTYSNDLEAKEDKSNVPSHFIYNKGCRVTLGRVNDASPRRWTLTAYISSNETGNITPDDTSATFTVDFFYKPPLLVQSRFTLYEGESFYQYLNTSDIDFKSCKVTHGKSEINLNLNISDNSEEKGTPLSLGNGLCGFKISKTKTGNSGKWTFNAVAVNNKPYRVAFELIILDRPDQSQYITKYYVFMGDFAFITCGSKYDKDYCFLYDPTDKLVYTTEKDCEHKIHTVTTKDLGNWTCVTGRSLTMSSINYTVEVISKAPETIEEWAVESVNSYSVGCRVRNVRSLPITTCKITSPNGVIFVPKLGVGTGRYFSIGTNYTAGACAIEIPKPLLDYENGLWRCEIFWSAFHMGRFVSIGKAKEPSYKKQFKVTKQIRERLPIICEVPFSSPYCHIRDPNGTLHFIDNDDPSFGRCMLDISSAEPYHNGTWSCSFARENGLPEEEIHIEVTIAEVLLLYRNEEVDSGSSAQLICSSGGLPLQICRFVSPSGSGYYITKDFNSSSMVYHGRGLEYGDCGIRLLNTHPANSGFWTCFVRFGAEELSAQIELKVNASILEDPNIVMTVSIAVGVVVVTALVGAIGYRIWRRRRNHTEIDRVSGSVRAQRRTDPDASSENVDIFSLDRQHRSYTNPQVVVDNDDHDHQL